MSQIKSVLFLFLLVWVLVGISGCTEPESETVLSSETTEDSALATVEDTDTAVSPTRPPTPLPPPDNNDNIDDEVEPVAVEEVETTEAEIIAAEESEDTAVSNTTTTIKADVWADNWFAFYLGEELIQEDSVSITTERSFNAESFTFEASYPLALNFIAKDFKENDTGLEYIGSNRQQMGDGGFIAQFTDTNSGQVIVVTNDSWKCTIIHKAPSDKTCANETNPIAGEGVCGFSSLAEPAGWKSTTFDDSAWQNANVYGVDQVRPKDGYDQISWDATAELIWTSDLETDNTILCRMVVEQP